MSGAEVLAGRLCAQCAEPAGPRDRYCEHCGARMAQPRRDRVEADVGVAAGVSDRGRRRHRNEDALALRNVGLRAGPGSARRGVAVAIVCDGVSSSARPDTASETAAEVAAETLAAALRAETGPVAATRQAIHAADRAVARLADSGGVDSAGADSEWADELAPACTFVSAIVTGDAVTIGWVGDSRAYWIPGEHTDSTPTRLTEDDSWLAQELAAGVLSPAQAATDRRAHAITAWLGEDADQVDPHVVTFEPEGPGVVVICTDGLWNYLDTVEELSAALPADAFEAPLDAARRLVEIALHCGGRDNVTVAVLPFVSPQRARHLSGTSPQSDRRDQHA
ncbi:MAG: serine/threonine-protein phosphatase [Pseudonocardiales bacterium]|nr:serine/threonine-protein phosphatase [Pseudonocardiales bacterium]MBV9031131.1 serine/threonine-protein phosphatase [Pseudonocardiales bacterium]MBW0008742.1 serine/threonine-protein phosphatase [Pseudonocardiales bacterium]